MSRRPCDFKCRKVKLAEIADVERAAKDKIYPAGTVHIQVSACRRSGLEQFRILREAGTIESKYAVIVPKVQAHPLYLCLALERCADEFMHRYVGSNINIQVENFKYFTLEWHDDYNTQKYIAELMGVFDKAIRGEEECIEALTDYKKYMLANMMI